MAQSYADRIKARPAYAAYKNRKKYLREAVKMGRITPEDREQLQEAAFWIYMRDPQVSAHHQAVASSPCGNLMCPSATRSDKCKCKCGGRYHGQGREAWGIGL